jgi:hypothetical protein
VLLASLEPIFQLGIARALADGGDQVIDGVPTGSDALVRRALESAPDAIVLGDHQSGTTELGPRLRAAAPAATLVLWRTDAQMVAVFAPGSDTPRLIPAPTATGLSKELFRYSGEGETCPST